MKRLLALVLAAFILSGTFATHVAYIEKMPTESDEWTYTNVSLTMSVIGFPSENFLIGGPPKFFTFNPLFHFALLDGWYRVVEGFVKSDLDMVTALYYGRLLSCFIAVLFIASIMWYVKTLTGRWRDALFVGASMSFAGWSTYTSSLVKLDTTSTFIGVLGLTFFIKSTRKQDLRYYLYCGLLLGLATVWKHVGGYVFLAVVIHWVLVRFKRTPFHIIILLCIVLVVTLFLGDMFKVAHDDYSTALIIQINRAVGRQNARGLNSGPSQWLMAIERTYWPYLGSLITIVVAAFVAAKKALVDHFWHKEDLWLAPLTSTVLASDILLVAIRLSNPHYFVLAEWEARAFLIVLALRYITKQGRFRKVVLVFMIVLECFDVGSLVIRAVKFSGRDALMQTYINLQSLPEDTILHGEEWLCSMKLFPCYQYDVSTVELGPEGVKPTIIVVQHTATLKEPDNKALQNLLGQSTELPEFRTSDAKSEIFVFRTPYATQ